MAALRLMPTKLFRLQISAFHNMPTIRRSLAAVHQIPVYAPAVPENPCAQFYRTKLDIGPFTCDWQNFPFSHFFTASREWHGLSEMEFCVESVLEIQGTIRPLAFLPVQDPCIVFKAGGNYYYLETCTGYVEDFGGDFASDDDFLAVFSHPPFVTGKRYWFPETANKKRRTNKVYAVVRRNSTRTLERSRGRDK
ncbi:hypothetical protein C8R45DRAFT_1047486 [Mycena sanguinolenta]|nr:hypothetical protein C8R45DRAFT_1047486 [Mycena sanguinolenta]